jgi:hypothetical protein
MMSPNVLFTEHAQIVYALPSVAAPTGVTPTRVTLKACEKVTAVILVANASTVTGSIITLLQSTKVAGTGEKALAFTNVRVNLDVSVNDTLVDTAVVSNTFTTTVVNSKNAMYVVDVKDSDLDTANNFCVFRVGVGNAVATTITVFYILWPLNYGKTTPLTTLLD